MTAEPSGSHNQIMPMVTQSQSPMSVLSNKEIGNVPQYVLPPLKALPADYMQIETFVKTAIFTKQNTCPSGRGSNNTRSQHYRAIVENLRASPAQTDLPLLYKVLRAFQGGQVLATIFSNFQMHNNLIHTILKLDVLPIYYMRQNNENDKVWLDDILDCYYHLLVAICSANSTFIHPVFEVLIKHILFIIREPGVSLSFGSADQSDEKSLAAQRKVNKVHAVIQKVVLLVPKAKMELFPSISSRYPFMGHPIHVVKNYFLLIFQFWEYNDFMREELFQLILKKCLAMDVEIRIEDNGNVILDPESLTEDKCAHLGEKEFAEELKKAKSVKDIANKLDACIFFLMAFLDQQDPLFYQTHMSPFIPTLLEVHKSKFVQFSFWFMMENDSRIESNHVPLYRQFISELIQIIYSTISAEITVISDSTIMSTASYLASFCSRAEFVDVESICEVLVGLLNWAAFYIKQESYSRNRLFYSVTQAIFYIMCYRGNEVLMYQSKGDVDDSYSISPLRFHDLFSNERLNPLQHCLSTVRDEFQKIGHHYGLIPSGVSSVTKSNKRKRAIQISSVGATTFRNQQLGGIRSQQGAVSNPLDSFFPFDPYLLHDSSTWIKQYRLWDNFIPDSDGGSEENEEMDQNDNLSVEDDNSITSASSLGSCDSSTIGSMMDTNATKDKSNILCEIPDDRWRRMSIESEGSW